MVIFLRKTSSDDEAYLYPLIKNVRNGEIIAKPPTKLSPREYNSNFMGHWKRESKGKGITLTIAPGDIKLLRSLFKVLQRQGNEYPVQIIQKGVK